MHTDWPTFGPSYDEDRARASQAKVVIDRGCDKDSLKGVQVTVWM